jgi:carbamoyl-phosphate synthase small subunit
VLVRSLSPVASNWRAEGSLHEWLTRRGIPALAELDTRALTRHLRTHGAQMGALSTEHVGVDALIEAARAAPPMQGRDLASEVSTRTPYEWVAPTWGTESAPPMQLHVVAYDFGIKRNILRLMRDRGIRVTVVPAETSVDDVLSRDPDGVFLSNGPGDPAALPRVVERLRELLASDRTLPVFGICLGHQLLCLSLGGRTYKLKFGHHGGNHPVRREDDGSIAITAQNHGFAVDAESIATLQEAGELTHLNLFDETVAGIRLRDRPVTSVQYHPEASPGPHDSTQLFVRFTEQLRLRREATARA